MSIISRPSWGYWEVVESKRSSARLFQAESSKNSPKMVYGSYPSQNLINLHYISQLHSFLLSLVFSSALAPIPKYLGLKCGGGTLSHAFPQLFDVFPKENAAGNGLVKWSPNFVTLSPNFYHQNMVGSDFFRPFPNSLTRSPSKHSGEWLYRIEPQMYNAFPKPLLSKHDPPALECSCLISIGSNHISH
jgi:hypothetical protein